MPKFSKEDSLDYAQVQVNKEYRNCIRKELEKFPVFAEGKSRYTYSTMLLNQVVTAVSTKTNDEKFDIMLLAISKLKVGLDEFHSYRYIIATFNNMLKQETMSEGETL